MRPTFRETTATRLALLGAVTLSLVGCGEEVVEPQEVARPVKMLEIGGQGGATREYPGRVKAAQYAEMAFEVPGRITEFVPQEGDAVAEGEVLARLDPRDYQARLDSERAKVQNARTELERTRILYEKEVAPKADLDLRQARYRVVEAAMREAEKALEDTVLRAPFDGVMARKLVEDFENVQAKQPVLVFQNEDLLEIRVDVPERDLTRRDREADREEVTRRLRPRVVISSLPDREIPARLEQLSTVADPATRTFEATVLFDPPDDVAILGGMTAKVVIDLPPSANALRIPASAVVPGEDGTAQVWVVDTDTMTVHARPVTLGDYAGDEVEVKGGLSSGDVIAVSGAAQLREGMTVRRFDL